MDNEELEFIEFLQDAKHVLSEDNIDQTPEDVERLINENKSAIQKRVEAQRQRELLEQQQYLLDRQRLQEERERFERERLEFDKKKLLFEQEKLTQERVEFQLDTQTQAYDPASVVEQALQFKQLHADLREIGVPVNDSSVDGFDSLNEQDRDHVLKIYQHLVHEIAKRSGNISIDKLQQLIDDAHGSTNVQNTSVYGEYLKLADSVNTSNQPVEQHDAQSEPDESIDEPSTQDKTRAETLREFRKGEYDYDAYRKRMQKHEDELQELYLAEDEQFGLVNENDTYAPGDSQFFNDVQLAREAELEAGAGPDDTGDDGDTDTSDDYRPAKMFPEAGDPGVPVPGIAPPPIDDFPDAPVPFPPAPPGLPPMFPPPTSTPTKTGGSAVATYDDPGATGTGSQTITGFDEPPNYIIRSYPETDPTNVRKSVVNDDGSWGPETWNDIPVPGDILTETITPSGESTPSVNTTSTVVLPPTPTPTGGYTTATYIDDGGTTVSETTSGYDETPRDVIVVHLETNPTNTRTVVVSDDGTWGPVKWDTPSEFPGGVTTPRNVIITVVAPSGSVTDTVLISPTSSGETDTTTTGGTVSAVTTTPVNGTVNVTLTGSDELPGIIVDTYISTVPDARKSVVVSDDGTWGPVVWSDVEESPTVKVDISNQSEDVSDPGIVIPTIYEPPTPIPDGTVRSVFVDDDSDGIGTTIVQGTAPPGDIVNTYRTTDPTGAKKSVVANDDGTWGPIEWPDEINTDISVNITPATTEVVGPNVVIPTGDISLPEQIIDERRGKIGHAANWLRVSEFVAPGPEFPDLNGYYAPVESFSLDIYTLFLKHTPHGECYIPRFIRVYDANGDLVLDPNNLQDAIVLVHYLSPDAELSQWCVIQGYVDGTEQHGFNRYPAPGAKLLYAWPSRGRIAICQPRPNSLCDGDNQIFINGEKVCPEEICMVDPYTGDETCFIVHYDTIGANNRRWFSAGGTPRYWRTTDDQGNYIYFEQDADGNMIPINDQQTKALVDGQLDGIDNNSSVTPWHMMHLYGGDNPRYPIDSSGWAPIANFPFIENTHRSLETYVPYRPGLSGRYMINDKNAYPIISGESIEYLEENIILQTYPRHVGPDRNKDGKLLNRRHFVIDIGLPRRVLEGTKLIEWSSDPRMFLSDTEMFTKFDPTKERTFGSPEYRRSDYYGCGSAPTDENGNILGGELIRQSCAQLKDTWIDNSIDRLAFNMTRTRFWWDRTGIPTRSMIERAHDFLSLLDAGDKYMEDVTGLYKVIEFYPDEQMTSPYRYQDWLDDLPPDTDPWWTNINRDFTLEYEIDPVTGKKTAVLDFFIGESSKLSSPV